MYQQVMHKIIIIAASLFCAQVAAQTKTQTYAWEDEKYPRERLIDMERMIVDVSFDAPLSLVKGQVTHYFKPLRKSVDSIFFSASSIFDLQIITLKILVSVHISTSLASFFCSIRYC